MERELKATVFYDIEKTEYTFNFDYLKKKFVRVKYIENMEGEATDKGQVLIYGNDYIVDDKKIILKQVSTNKDKPFIYIYRQTTTDSIVSFSDSSIMKSKDFNIGDIQKLHLYEELADYVIIHDVTSETISKIYAVLKQVQALESSTQQAKNQAISAADSANNASDVANNILNNIKTIENNINTILDNLSIANFLDVSKALITFKYIQESLIFPIANVLVNETLYIENSLYTGNYLTNKLVLKFKGEDK